MATIIQSDFGKGILTPPRPQSAGAIHCAEFKYTFATAFAYATQILELGVLPAFAKPVDAILVPEGVLTGLTADIGLMSGTAGSTATDRTSDDSIFNDIALDAGLKRAVAITPYLITPVAYDRSIGFKASGDIAAASTKKIALLLYYTQ